MLAKFDRLAGKFNLVPKKRKAPKINFLDMLTLEGAEGQIGDIGSTSGIPCKLGGIMVQTSYVEGRWHQN